MAVVQLVGDMLVEGNPTGRAVPEVSKLSKPAWPFGEWPRDQRVPGPDVVTVPATGSLLSRDHVDALHDDEVALVPAERAEDLRHRKGRLGAARPPSIGHGPVSGEHHHESLRDLAELGNGAPRLQHGVEERKGDRRAARAPKHCASTQPFHGAPSVAYR